MSNLLGRIGRHVVLSAVALTLMAGVTRADDPIKIGAIMPLSGAMSLVGEPQSQTLDMIADEINSKGGLLGRRLEIIKYDDQGDANKALTFVNRLIESDGVSAILGPATTGQAMAVAPAVEESGVPLIPFGGGIPIFEPFKKWVFKIPHDDRQACQLLMSDMSKRGFKSLALISDNGTFGQSMRRECKSAAAKVGIGVVADEVYGNTDTDVTPQLTRIKETAGVDVVLNPGVLPGAIIVAKNYHTLGIPMPLYVPQSVAGYAYIKLAGGAAEGVRMVVAGGVIPDIIPDNSPQAEVVREYQKEFVLRYKTPVSMFGGQAHDALWIVAKAIEAARSDKREDVRNAIERTTNFVGFQGIISYSSESHRGPTTESLWLVDIKDGRMVLAH